MYFYLVIEINLLCNGGCTMEKKKGLLELRIAVCDDMEPICQRLVSIIRQVMEQEQMVGIIDYYTSGQNLLEQMEKYNLFFLDMDMPNDMDGVEVGIHIRIRNPECGIIIESIREDRFKETYDMIPLRFISKPFDKVEVREALYAYLERQAGYEKIEVYKERLSYIFRQRDIQYITARKGFVEITIDNEIYQIKLTLNQIEKMLDKRIFVKVHKSHIVNLINIEKKECNRIKYGRQWIPISRRQEKVLRDAYLRYGVKYR